MKYALGIIETVGLAAGIQAADTCVKSANVTLIGYELTKGDGMATVKIEGNVGAVNAAIDAAKASASLVNKVFGYRVIPRPSDSLEMLVRNSETVGYAESSPPQVESKANAEPPIASTAEQVEEAEEEEVTEEDDVAAQAEVVDEPEDTSDDVAKEAVLENVNEEIEEVVAKSSDETVSEPEAEVEIEAAEELIPEDETEDDEVCNICKDPACTRKKGDLRRFCIHYYDDK